MMDYMFNGSKFNSDISDWNVEKVRSMVCAFQDCPFDQDITRWNPKSIEHHGFVKTFEYCPLKLNKKLPKWYKARF
jgi:surface protein